MFAKDQIPIDAHGQLVLIVHTILIAQMDIFTHTRIRFARSLSLVKLAAAAPSVKLKNQALAVRPTQINVLVVALKYLASTNAVQAN